MSQIERAAVPCDGCTACCRHELLILHPDEGDDPSQYETQVIEHPLTGRPAIALAQKPNGDCRYLGVGGCTIWDRAPLICRTFDCRKFLAAIGGRPAQRRALKSGLVTKDIFDAARRLGRAT